MRPEVLKVLVQQLVDIEFKGSVHYHFYNEPLLFKGLEDYVSLVKNKLPETRSKIYTNGKLLDRDRFQNLIAAGVDQFIVTKHEGEENGAFEKMFFSLSESEKAYIKYEGYSTLILSNRGGVLDVGKDVKSLPLSRPCYIPTMSLVVTLLGNVLTCYEDFYQQSQQGNILETHIRDIWLSPPYVAFREALAQGKRSEYEVCRKCNNTQVII